MDLPRSPSTGLPPLSPLDSGSRKQTPDSAASDGEHTTDSKPSLSAPKSSDVPALGKEGALGEYSPLLQPLRNEGNDDLPDFEPVQSPNDHHEESMWAADGTGNAESKSTWYLILLTLSIGGLQLAWSLELSYGSPYLLGLGISKSLLALVWIAGPLSGTLVQPYVGIKSDRCRLKYGKRRPFIVGGAIATIVSLMLLAWVREITGVLLGIFGVARESRATSVTAIVFATIMIYILDFSINVIQAGIRAFIIDNAPVHQQDTANAWASRITSIGNIIAYIYGYADLPRIFPFLGYTQFKGLCALASIGLGTTVLISCLSISERDPRLEGPPSKQSGGVFTFFKDLYFSIRRLPPQIKAICRVQFLAWIGWFPFLFYITTYIGQIYVDPIFRANPNMTPEEIEETWDDGTRRGTFALEIFALTTFGASVFLPWFIQSSYRSPDADLQPSAASSTKVLQTQRNQLARFFARRPLEIPGLTLRRAWMLSHILFALLTFLTFISHTMATATVIVGLVGIPWAMTSWAPFALIAAEIRKRDALRRGIALPSASARVDTEALLPARGDTAADDDRGGSEIDRDGSNDVADQAGTILGIHNVAIAAPQIIATLVSSAIFRALQKPRGSVGDDSVAWVLRLGGCAALAAAYLTTRIAEERR